MLYWIMPVVFVTAGQYEACSAAFLPKEEKNGDNPELCSCFLPPDWAPAWGGANWPGHTKLLDTTWETAGCERWHCKQLLNVTDVTSPEGWLDFVGGDNQASQPHHARVCARHLPNYFLGQRTFFYLLQRCWSQQVPDNSSTAGFTRQWDLSLTQSYLGVIHYSN